MRKKNTPNDLYWQSVANQQIRDEYAAYLNAEGREKSPLSAQLFAMGKINNGYREKSERELIILLAGELPYMYD